MKTTEELMNLGLPKWPQMIVTGKKIDSEQAMEIIRRTDTFITSYAGGNNRDFVKKAKETLRLVEMDEYRKEDGSYDWAAYGKAQEDYREKWGSVETEYVHNSWISSSYIYGAYGWCHPDGTISYMDNVGKWPSVKEICDEWSVIAKEFPFLEIGVTLMNGEQCEEHISPVVSMRIKDGIVELVDPDIEDVHVTEKTETYTGLQKASINARATDKVRDAIFEIMTSRTRENAISLNVLQKWTSRVFG